MRIMYCDKCGKYTLAEKCACGSRTRTRSPARFRPDDRYGKYRREIKWSSLSKE